MAHLSDGAQLSLPLAARHLSEILSDLNATRGAGFDGPEPIMFAEIAAWAALNGPLAVWEVRVLRAMDRALMRHHDQKSGRETPDPSRRASADHIKRVMRGMQKR